MQFRPRDDRAGRARYAGPLGVDGGNAARVAKSEDGPKKVSLRILQLIPVKISDVVFGLNCSDFSRIFNPESLGYEFESAAEKFSENLR